MCNIHMRFIASGEDIFIYVYIASYMEFQKIIHNPKFLSLFWSPHAGCHMFLCLCTSFRLI